MATAAQRNEQEYKPCVRACVSRIQSGFHHLDALVHIQALRRFPARLSHARVMVYRRVCVDKVAVEVEQHCVTST
jgi:hypothetical protein